MAGYNLIDLLFQLFNLLWGRTGFKPVIQLAFFALDVCRYGTPAAEEPDHGLIDDMFRRVHRRVLRFVMLVELNLLFHSIMSLNCDVNSSRSCTLLCLSASSIFNNSSRYCAASMKLSFLAAFFHQFTSALMLFSIGCSSCTVRWGLPQCPMCFVVPCKPEALHWKCCKDIEILVFLNLLGGDVVFFVVFQLFLPSAVGFLYGLLHAFGNGIGIHDDHAVNIARCPSSGLGQGAV